MPKPKTHRSPDPTYQTLRAELDAILAELQREDLDIDEALTHYRRGQELIGQLQNYLKTAENTLSELQAKASPTPE